MKETIIIKKVIMHYLNVEKHDAEYSEQLIDLTQDNSSYYSEKVKKAFTSKKKKEVICNSGCEFVVLAKNMVDLDDETFVMSSKSIASTFYNLSVQSENMPNSNILCILCGIDDHDYIFAMKLNHSTAPVNFITNKDNQKLIKVWDKQSLPLKSKAVEEALIYNADEQRVEIIEKKFKFDGKAQTYINELYLEGETLVSNKETLDALKGSVKNVAGDSMTDLSKDPVVKLKKEFVDSILNQKDKTTSQIVDEVFKEDVFSKQAVYGQLQDHDIDLDKVVELTDSYDKIQKCKVTTDDGISISLDLKDFENTDRFEIVNNEDGTCDIKIKRLQSIIVD